MLHPLPAIETLYLEFNKVWAQTQEKQRSQQLFLEVNVLLISDRSDARWLVQHKSGGAVSVLVSESLDLFLLTGLLLPIPRR